MTIGKKSDVNYFQKPSLIQCEIARLLDVFTTLAILPPKIWRYYLEKVWRYYLEKAWRYYLEKVWRY